MTAALPATSRHLMLHGSILLTLGLASGLTIPLAQNPRTVLAAHVIGITTGLAAIAVGACMPYLALNPMVKRIMLWTLLPSLYLGFITQWLGGMFKLSRMFIVTAAGQPKGNAMFETAMEYIIKGISPLTLLPFLMLAYGLYKAKAEA